MKRWIMMLLIALPLPAYAEDCGQWSAAMQEDEGGSIMTASVCAPAGKAMQELSITCRAPGMLSIRFIPVAPAGYPPEEPAFKTDLEFSFDQEMFTRTAEYEEMDGALVVEAEIDSPFLYVLQAQKQMSLVDVDGKLPTAMFTLSGSKAALGKVIASCPKQ